MPSLFLTDAAVKRLPVPAEGQTDHWDTQVKGFGLRISSGGTRTFVVNRDKRRIKIGTYDPNLPTHMSLADAREAALKLKFVTKPAGRVTFDEARADFFTRHLDTLKATTAHEQKNLMRRFPFSKPLVAITLQDVTRVLDAMPRGSARSCFNVLRTFFNWCVANDYLEHSPLKKSPYKAGQRDRLLTDEEVARIWRALPADTFGCIVRSLFLSGQRLSQIALFEPAWIRKDTILFPPRIMKSNAEHVIPAPDALLRHLPSRTMTTFSRPMNDLRDSLKDIPHWTLHDTRRYFSSTMAKLRTPIDITEAILDHRSGSRSQVQRIYDRHDRLPQMRTAMSDYHRHLLDGVLKG